MNIKLPSWKVEASAKVERQIGKLSTEIEDLFELLKRELELNGRGGEGWPRIGPVWQFGKKRKVVKVHLVPSNRKPCYVALYEVFKKERRIQVLYVGTHENSPHGR